MGSGVDRKNSYIINLEIELHSEIGKAIWANPMLPILGDIAFLKGAWLPIFEELSPAKIAMVVVPSWARRLVFP
jgi:hypothetical protein